MIRGLAKGSAAGFDVLMNGIGAMRDQREGKLTLRNAEIGDLPPLARWRRLIRETREQMNCSRAVFARRLRVSPRTLEAWEQRNSMVRVSGFRAAYRSGAQRCARAVSSAPVPDSSAIRQTGP
ncbi:MAG: hypothetical protein WBG92_07285 [Thiohalocapsa sp.]